MLVRIMILFITFLLLSCSFEPWKTVQYKDLKIENVRLHRYSNSLPDKTQFKDNYLNGAFISISAKGKNATVYSSKEPYAISINLKGKTDEHINFTVSDIKILSSKGIDYSELIHGLPVVIDLITIDLVRQNDDYVYGGYATDYIFNFCDDEIYISLILDVLTYEKNEKREMFFTLSKIIKRGLFQSYW